MASLRNMGLTAQYINGLTIEWITKISFSSFGTGIPQKDNINGIQHAINNTVTMNNNDTPLYVLAVFALVIPTLLAGSAEILVALPSAPFMGIGQIRRHIGDAYLAGNN